jgi:plastocyanin domain-containing protein
LSFRSTDPVRSEESKFTASVDKDGVQRVEVLAGSYFFKPDYIIVKVNVPVELRIREEPGLIPHDFVLKAPEAGIDIKEELSTEPRSVEFTPRKKGMYPFYCDKKFLFWSHRKEGMEGTLDVRE